jgi:hypothetical protein
MKTHQWTILAAFVFALPAAAAAQNQSPPTPTESVQPPATGGSPLTGRWVASGFVGSNFANNASPASTDYGGSLAYLWKNSYGAEFDVGFTPNFQLQNNFFGLGVQPQVNSYMANAAWAKALGPDGQWQPFVSAGAGALSLRSGLGSTTDALGNTLSPNSTRFGGDFGGGFMGFSGNWGFKADVRYYRATGSYNTTPSTSTSTSPSTPVYAVGVGGVGGGVAAASMTTSSTGLASAALAGLHFWRANIGVALRW